jgi:hypothetical protein
MISRKILNAIIRKPDAQAAMVSIVRQLIHRGNLEQDITLFHFKTAAALQRFAAKQRNDQLSQTRHQHQ